MSLTAKLGDIMSRPMQVAIVDQKLANIDAFFAAQSGLPVLEEEESLLITNIERTGPPPPPPLRLCRTFATAEEAVLAYDEAAWRLYGPDAFLNLPHLRCHAMTRPWEGRTGGGGSRRLASPPPLGSPASGASSLLSDLRRAVPSPTLGSLTPDLDACPLMGEDSGGNSRETTVAARR
ncbi:hypothetical protein E2562_032377 [Oryza meyeriana var. granulata]|uniref:AP2/ERF domain-containing protein n=1 Tax=Oryza meyeriana var. granulata TaxID=110450 RepID=A0A6G1CBP3_9ORYZ|nr:hypothetical protein E2562_032377 [Oryza meyeriana var. granulata]